MNKKMKQLIKANNVEQALQQLEKIGVEYDESKISEIPEKERGYFHVLSVKIIPNFNKMTNDALVNVHVFNKKVFEKFIEQYVYQAIEHVIVFHNPNKEKLDESYVPNHMKNDLEEEIRAEIEAKYQKEFEERLKARTLELKKEILEQDKAAQKKKEDELKKEKKALENQEKEEHEAKVKEAKDFDSESFYKEVISMNNYQKSKSFAKSMDINITGTRTLVEVQNRVIGWLNEKMSILDGAKAFALLEEEK